MARTSGAQHMVWLHRHVSRATCAAAAADHGHRRTLSRHLSWSSRGSLPPLLQGPLRSDAAGSLGGAILCTMHAAACLHGVWPVRPVGSREVTEMAFLRASTGQSCSFGSVGRGEAELLQGMAKARGLQSRSCPCRSSSNSWVWVLVAVDCNAIRGVCMEQRARCSTSTWAAVHGYLQEYPGVIWQPLEAEVHKSGAKAEGLHGGLLCTQGSVQCKRRPRKGGMPAAEQPGLAGTGGHRGQQAHGYERRRPPADMSWIHLSSS